MIFRLLPHALLGITCQCQRIADSVWGYRACPKCDPLKKTGDGPATRVPALEHVRTDLAVAVSVASSQAQQRSVISNISQWCSLESHSFGKVGRSFVPFTQFGESHASSDPAERPIRFLLNSIGVVLSGNVPLVRPAVGIPEKIPKPVIIRCRVNQFVVTRSYLPPIGGGAVYVSQLAQSVEEFPVGIGEVFLESTGCPQLDDGLIQLAFVNERESDVDVRLARFW